MKFRIMRTSEELVVHEKVKSELWKHDEEGRADEAIQCVEITTFEELISLIKDIGEEVIVNIHDFLDEGFPYLEIYDYGRE